MIKVKFSVEDKEGFEAYCDYLTPEKVYEANPLMFGMYGVVADTGETADIVVGHSCCHLGDYGLWEVVEDE